MEYEPGDRVSHDKYGLGRVESVEEGASVVIDFGGTRRRVALTSAQLNKL